MSVLPSRLSHLFGICCLLLVALAIPSAQEQAPAPKPAVTGSLDAFMEKVLARRELNRKVLNDYILDETENFEILGPGRYRLHRSDRQFTWYVRDGMHVRSPLKFNGVSVDEKAREEYENDWIRREKARQERKAKADKDGKDAKRQSEVTIGPGGVTVDTGGAPIATEPRFVSEAYFMDFKFEPGNYYLAGREQLEGHEVLRIEYYPTNLFKDDDKKTPNELKERSREQRREDKTEADINRRMNKTALVTLWVDPTEHQIVKYTFDNVWLDFLPGAWLVRVDDIRASMTMGQPFPGVWLPRAMSIHAGVTLANGSFEAAYGRAFDQYREAQVRTTIRVPKGSARVSLPQLPNAQLPNVRMRVATVAESGDLSSGPFVDDSQAPPQQEMVREVRIHGNAFLTDAEVLKLAGVELNSPLAVDGVAAIEQRLKASHRFETIEVRKRYRSLDDPTDVALVLVVHERPGVKSGSTETPAVFRPLSRLKSQLMFLPILSYADGYGFTYGGRVSTVDYLGLGERLSVPLTWGGTRRAAIEFDRGFKSGPISRVTSSFGIWNRENPRYEIREQRVELTGRIEREIKHIVRLGLDGSKSSVGFGDIDDHVWTVGANVALDTRSNPIFPGNAVYLATGWSALNVQGQPRINRYTSDARGYLRLYRQTVLAARAQYLTADAPLPIYERMLVGGASNLRGFDTGAFDGDTMFGTSAEVRAPITSVISGAKFGLSAFVDAVRVADYGASLADAEWRRGVGGGIFIVAPLVTINMGVGHGLNGGGNHFFLSSGFGF